MEKRLQFNSIIKNVETLNPLFSRANLYVLYTGINRNNSYISKDSVVRNINSIFNVPVIGEYIESSDNFGGHGGKIEVTDNEVKYVSTTKPYGVVPESANIYWENVTEKDGTVNEYLVVDGVFLWTGRYPELNVLLEQGYMNHSMEIEVLNADWGIVDGQEVFKIHDFVFSGLCILGIDKGNNPSDHVEPCFESSKIIVGYSLDKNKFKQEFNQMLAELKFSMSKGGNEELENIQEEFETTVETTETQVEEAQTESADEVAVEAEVETTDKQEVTEEFTEETQVESTETVEAVVEETKDEVTEEVVEEFEVATITEEVTKTEVETTVTTIETEGDTTVADLVTKDKKDDEKEIIDFESKFKDLSVEFKSLKVEIEELREFKRKTQEAELSAQFEGQLTSDELSQVFEQSKESSIEDIEKELFALVGKKNFSMMKETPVTKIAVDIQSGTEINEPYGGLISKYLNK